MPYVFSLGWIPDEMKVIDHCNPYVQTQKNNDCPQLIRFDLGRANTAEAIRNKLEELIEVAQKQPEYDDSMYMEDVSASMCGEFLLAKDYVGVGSKWRLKPEGDKQDGTVYEVIQRAKNDEGIWVVLFKKIDSVCVYISSNEDFVKKYERTY